MVYNIGSDGGNSTIKQKLSTGMRIIYPNVLVPKTLHYNKYKGNGKPTRDKLDVEITIDRLNRNEVSRVIFGEGAKEYVNAASGNRANMDKSNDDDLVKAQLIATAYSIFLDNYRKGKNLCEKKGARHSFRVNIGTALPYEESVREGAIDKYREKLMGNHLIKFKNPDFNELTMELVVENALTHYVEGEVVLDLLLEKINEDPNELLGSIFAVADGGAYTFDVTGAEFEKDFDEDLLAGTREEFIQAVTKDQFSFGIERGIGHVFQEIIEDVEAENTDILKRYLDRKDIEDALEVKLEGKKGWIMPERIYVGDKINERTSVYARQVAKKFISHYNNANAMSKVKRIYLTGGASKIDAFVDTFVDVLKEEGYDPDIIIRLSNEPDPIYANAEGCLVALEQDLEEIKMSEAGELRENA